MNRSCSRVTAFKVAVFIAFMLLGERHGLQSKQSVDK